MHIQKVYLILLSTIILTAAGCSQSSIGTLSVFVIDEQRTPVSGVTVTIKPDHDSKWIKNMTSADGMCVFHSLAEGNDYVLKIKKQGFISKFLKNVEVIPGRNVYIRMLLKVDSKMFPGRWRLSRFETKTNKLNSKQKEAIKRLETLGYLSGYKKAPKARNVTIYDKKKAFNGLNLYCSGHAPEAILIDMNGKQVYRWHYTFNRTWKKKIHPHPNRSGHRYWRHVHLMENGDLLAIFEGYGLIKLDKDSNLIWSFQDRTHHDLFVMPDGKIYVLTRKALLNPKYNKTELIVDDFITILSPGGKEIRRVSILKCLENSNYAYFLEKAREKGDILHTNTVEVLKGKLAHKSPAFKPGNVLISILLLDLIAVVDMEKESVVWAMSDMWKRQHDPGVLDNGNMLVFDNLYGPKPVSRVLEFDPFNKHIHWEYRGTSETPFYTGDCGACQRLPNGNTLISESNSGRAFEVTPGKTIAWEFYNPHRAGKNNELIATLFEMTRIGPDHNLNWLKNSKNN